MAKTAPRITYTLDTLTYTAGAKAPAVSFRSLPPMFDGKYVHLEKVVFGVTFTPTYGSTDTPLVVGMNNVVSSLEITDGENIRFTGDGGFNLLRLKERFSAGRNRLADADTDPASTVARYFRRVWHPGPPQFEGAPADWLVPVGLLSTGEIRAQFGTLAQVGQGATGNPSAVTATIRITCFLQLLDHVNIPPLYEFRTYSAAAADLPITGACLLESMAMLNSANYDAITAGDFGTLRLDLGFGDVVNAPAADMAACYHDDFRTGGIEGFSGEPEASGDDNIKIVNRASPTAVAAASNDVQPVLWSPEGSRINKLYPVRNVARLRWSGSQSTATVAVGRILPQDQNALGRAMLRAGVSPTANGRISTISKKDYAGTRGSFMPVKIRP